MTATSVARVVRALPAAAGLIYAFVLLRRLPDIVDQVTLNADYVSAMALAQSVGANGKSGRAVIIQIGWYWFDLVTLHLPYHRQVWEYAPFVLAMSALALIVWTAWRVAGRFAGVLAASIGVAAGPIVVGTQVAQSYHGTTWFGCALLAAYLCAVISMQTSRWTLVASSVAVALLAGFATGTDPLLLPSGDAPFALTLGALWWLRKDEVPREKLLAGAGAAAGIALTAGAMVLAGRLAGYVSSFPRGLTHLVTPDHVAGNARQLVSGVFEVAGMPHEGSTLGLLLGLILTAALLIPFIWLIRVRARGVDAATVAVVGFWVASVLGVASAFFFSDIPHDFLQNSSRYLISMFYAVAATVPIWAARDPRRLTLIAAPATLLILANAAAVDRTAAGGLFGPSFNSSLSEPITFLEQHGLTHGYAAYDEAAPMSFKSDFVLNVYPVTQVVVSPDDECGDAICPFAYNSLSDWYRGDGGPTFILVDPATYRLDSAPPAGLDQVVMVYQVGRYEIYVYADDVAAHMGTPRRFTRSLF
ncbi:MAG TPA: hypothetical protein VGV88_08040 [Candidatus Dormibacteraeota bacterium]|nr:hypothetical protein [Candidatus Dormibacteraeota bacterium]